MTKSEGGAPESIELKELPQFNPNTGLSFDYRNEYSFLIGYLDFLGIDEVRKVLDKLKEELMQFVKKDYAGHAYPKEIQFLEKLPKNNSGKIVRAKLKEMN